MITQKLQVTSTFSNGLASITGSDTEVGNAVVGGIDQYFAASTVNQAISLAFTLANLQAIVLLSDKGCTIKTNSTTTPSQTITLVPGIPLVWGVSSGQPCPFTTNVTTAYVSNTVAQNLKISGITS